MMDQGSKLYINTFLWSLVSECCSNPSSPTYALYFTHQKPRTKRISAKWRSRNVHLKCIFIDVLQLCSDKWHGAACSSNLSPRARSLMRNAYVTYDGASAAQLGTTALTYTSIIQY